MTQRINKYGLELVPLNLELAMLVRNWRNSHEVNQFMDYQKEISKQEQEQWFKSTQDSSNYYFVVQDKQTPFGFIHLDRFSTSKKTAYAGLFIGEEAYRGTGMVYAASLALLDFAFEKLKLNCVFAKVKSGNNEALDYNRSLGFEIDGNEKEGFLRLKLNPSIYMKKKSKLMDLLSL